MQKIALVWKILSVACLALLGSAAENPVRSLGDLSGNWWLALDSRVCESRGTASLRFHQFQKYSGNPVLRADKVWEGSMSYVYGTILPQEDGKGLRMWYHAYVEDKAIFPAKHRYTTLYATSSDGFHWNKPELGLYSFHGSTANNLVLQRSDNPGASHSPNVMHTPGDPDPNRRYKMVTYVYYDGYYGSTSPDGIHWTDLPQRQILEDPGDVGNFIWDARRSAYIGYPKIFDEIRGFRRRCVGFSETRDFAHWPKSRLILAPDEEDDRGYLTPDGRTEFYGLSAFPYQTMYLGFLWIYRLENGDERIWPELVYSADGVKWARVPAPRAPVLPLGVDGTWDDGMIFTPNHPLIRDGRVQLYYGAFDGPHNARGRDGAIGLASMRRDGFASLDAGAAETAVTTAVFQGASGSLMVNADAQGGELRAELLDAAGKPLAGYTKDEAEAFQGSKIDQILRWKTKESLPTEPFRIRFWLRRAALYSFFAGEEASHANADASIAVD
jgi:hypothetical protein